MAGFHRSHAKPEGESGEKLLTPADRSALDRTFASWVRTGASLCVLGLVVLRLGYYLAELAEAYGKRVPAGGLAVPLGMLHVLLGAAMIALAALWHGRTRRAVTAGHTDPRPLSQWVVVGITAGSVVGGVGLALDLLLTAAG